LNCATSEIFGNGKIDGLKFSDGKILKTDMLVISAGIKPRDDLAKECGLKCGERGGIEVDERMRTSDEHIYAIGECALYNGMIYGLVAPGYRMAETALNALNLSLGGSGESLSFTGADMSTKLKLLGIDVASIGNAQLEGEEYNEVVYENGAEGVYKKVILLKDTNTIAGCILVGDADEYLQIHQKYLNKTVIENDLKSLIGLGTGENSGKGLENLPDEAQICSCENVTKGQILKAFDEGNKDPVSIKKFTGAGSGCGSCMTLVTDLVNMSLEKSGQKVNKDLCEHFDFTRQELVTLIKKEKLTSFPQILQKLGNGKGCEICKPAIGSILASYVNQLVFDHQNIQDTNDYFLGNIQKNGTYSVIPRVPGGEITPDQLIAIGEVAKEFSLYTKITGGQRIDLFGARIDQLPLIWKKLIDAGMETGHAYAKSLRTVKSCVGSTWCRFGVEDSTGLAIKLENRYKGLRAPHKIKFAVSGCARECAEAQSKDVGIIATENGWNLYVCGNGGMKPQHAVMLAADLNESTLIKYIDRFMMYYVRSADRLMRTATWLNKMEGGIDHLKKVLIEDSLGINIELEKEMQYIVDTYECEWKKVVEDPDKIKQFRHFINSSNTDEGVQFEKIRDQMQPV